MKQIEAVDLSRKFAQIEGLWNPHVVAECNGQEVKLAVIEGEFVWHHHADADELFLVLEGQLDIEMRDQVVTLGPGQLHVVPRGVEHRPVAHGRVHLLMFEPAGTCNTGEEEVSERTVPSPKKI